MLSIRSIAALAVVLLVGLANTALAQSDRGTLTGTVQDASGAVVPGAVVTLTNTSTGAAMSVPTNEAGDYTVPQLPPGTYTVKVEKEGFRPASVTGIELNASATVRADATLEVGTAVQAVEVSASAMALSTENAKTSVTVTNKLVDELPLVVGGGDAQPVQSGGADAGSQERRRRQRLHPGRRTGRGLRHQPGWRVGQHLARAVSKAGWPSTLRRSKRSPSSRSTPTASRPSTGRPRAAS